MPNLATRADSLRFHHTGAASAGAAQTNPAACLGGYRASTEMAGLGFCVDGSHILNLRIDYASHANGTGEATITAVGPDTIRYTPPSDDAGADLYIANGDSIIIEGADAEKYLRVTRMSTDSLMGTTTLQMFDSVNNAVGFDNVTGVEEDAGDTEYRAIALYNAGAFEITNVKAWLGASGPAIGYESPSSDAIQTIANEGTAPSGISWNTGTTAGAGLAIGPIAAGQWVGLWIKRPIAAGVGASVSVLQHLRFSFDASAS